MDVGCFKCVRWRNLGINWLSDPEQRLLRDARPPAEGYNLLLRNGHNQPYTSATSGSRNLSIRRRNSTNSATRCQLFPPPHCTYGSGAARLVNRSGIVRRSPPAVRNQTRSSPHRRVRPTSSSCCWYSGWKGWITRNFPLGQASSGAVCCVVHERR